MGKAMEQVSRYDNQSAVRDGEFKNVAPESSLTGKKRSSGRSKAKTDGCIDYTRTSCVRSMQLIHEVKKFEIIYNSELPEYKYKACKEPAWLEINRKLFPNFDSLNPVDREAIRKTVRRRWKSLRDCLVKAIRLKQNMNAQMQAMSYLLPFLHISSTGENGAVNDGQKTNEDTENNGNNETFNSFYADETQQYYSALDGDQSNDVISIKSEGDETILSESSLSDAILVKDEKDSEQVLKEDSKELIKSKSPDEADEHVSVRSEGAGPHDQNDQSFIDDSCLTSFDFQITEPLERRTKRKRCCVESNVDFTVLDILQQNALDLKDEDRMFLLSILSDFKRILPEKKLKVKAKIVDAIAQALD